MVLDADAYRVNVKRIKDLTERMSREQRIGFLSELAIITSVPIIICGYYLLEIYGFDGALLATIERLKHFYDVRQVLNVKLSNNLPVLNSLTVSNTDTH